MRLSHASLPAWLKLSRFCCRLTIAPGFKKIIEDRVRPVKHVQRAQIVFLSAGHLPVLEIAERVRMSRPMVWRWQQRYAEQGLDGLLRDKTARPAFRQSLRPRSIP